VLFVLGYAAAIAVVLPGYTVMGAAILIVLWPAIALSARRALRVGARLEWIGFGVLAVLGAVLALALAAALLFLEPAND
jgi:hypothetical protein